MDWVRARIVEERLALGAPVRASVGDERGSRGGATSLGAECVSPSSRASSRASAEDARVSNRAGSAGRCTDLSASSSAMIRRIEASISSIDGSWVFAACAIELLVQLTCLSAPRGARLWLRFERAESPRGLRRKFAVSTRIAQADGVVNIPKIRHPKAQGLGYLPSGVRTPIQASRTCW